MRSVLILLFFLLPVNVFAATDYQLSIQLYPENQSLSAKLQLELDEANKSQLQFLLSERCQVLEVKQAGQDLEYSFKDGLLSVSLVNRRPLSISYKGRFDDHVSSVPVHNEDPGYGVSATIGTEETFLSAAANWYPRLVEGNVVYRLQVRTPAGIEAISSGQRISHSRTETGTESTWLVDYPLYGLTLTAGPYQLFTDESGSIPIYALFYAESAQFAEIYLKAAREYLQLYENRFGPYPFHKFAVVENFFPTGYGFPSWTLLGSSVIRLPFIVKTSLGHEIAHSWWGTGVRVDYNEGNWAEGITTYVADYLYKELSSPEEALEYRLKILRDYSVLVDKENSFPLNRFSSRNDRASQAIGYGKAAMLFHMLRSEVGDDIFWSTLKKIAEEELFKTIGWKRIASYFCEASGRDLHPFFEQWLQRDGGPEISLQDVTVGKSAAGYRISGVIQQSLPSYRLKIPLQVTTEQGSKDITIQLEREKQTFSLSTTERPREIALDPDSDLFRILGKEEIPSTINAIRSSRHLLAVYAENYRPSSEASNTLLAAFRQTATKIKPLAELSSQDITNHDLLIFGTGASLQPDELQGDRLVLDGTETELKGNAVFLIKTNPYNSNRVISWFLAAENPQDAAVARKIPHYGKYSYLLFAAANNQMKGTFPPLKTPLRQVLTDQHSTAEVINSHIIRLASEGN